MTIVGPTLANVRQNSSNPSRSQWKFSDFILLWFLQLSLIETSLPMRGWRIQLWRLTTSLNTTSTWNATTLVTAIPSESKLILLTIIHCHVVNTHLLSDGSGDVHCQLEKVSGNLPPFWGWVPNATYEGNKTFHEVVYDVWQYTVRMSVLILEVIAPVWTESCLCFRESQLVKINCFITFNVPKLLFPFTGCWVSANTSCSSGWPQHAQVFRTQNWSSYIGIRVQDLHGNNPAYKGLWCSKGVYWRSSQPLASLQAKAFSVESQLLDTLWTGTGVYTWLLLGYIAW